MATSKTTSARTKPSSTKKVAAVKVKGVPAAVKPTAPKPAVASSGAAKSAAAKSAAGKRAAAKPAPARRAAAKPAVRKSAVPAFAAAAPASSAAAAASSDTVEASAVEDKAVVPGGKAPTGSVAESTESALPGKAGKTLAARRKAPIAGTAKPALKKVVAQPVEKGKEKREKVVRDSFSMPKSEHAGLKMLRTDLARAGRICTKSELLRAGLQLASARSVESLVKLLDKLPVVPKGKSSKK